MTTDALTALAHANPVREISRLQSDTKALWAETLRRIDSEQRSKRVGIEAIRLRRRGPILGSAVVALALALPALAFSGALGDLFGFSNEGSPPTSTISDSSLSGLSRVGGTPESVRILATHGDLAFYGARSKSGYFCVGTAPAGSGPIEFGRLSCGESRDDSFPSPAVPVDLVSNFFGQVGSSDLFITRLAGFAADGVARVEASGSSGVVSSAEVEDNVFYADAPHVAVTRITAYDAGGQKVWEMPVIPNPAAIAPPPPPKR